MRLHRVSFLLLLFLLAACRASPAPTTLAPVEGADTPKQAVEELIGALAAGDWQATAPYVDETQIALLTAIEGVPASETAEMLRAGLTNQVRANFWQGFVEGFLMFSQEEASQLLLGDPTHFEVEGLSFSAVALSLRHHPGIGSWIVRNTDGDWWVDLFATIGPSFANPLRDWLESLPDDDNGRLIRAEMVAQEPSFTAALTQEPLGEVSDGARFEVRLLMIEAKS
ncbi:MAG: hypothetical protein ACE5MI_09470 [Acidimicrobiia bacterium]